MEDTIPPAPRPGHPSESCMQFVHPSLRPLLEAARGQPTLAQSSVAQAREQIVKRTALRRPGPAVDSVVDLEARGTEGVIPIRLYRPDKPSGLVVAFHGGGWLMGSRDSFDATCRHLAVES